MNKGAMMYAVIVEDRHTDVEVLLFSRQDDAVTYAQSVIDANSESALCVDSEDTSLTDAELRNAGWLFYGCYSTEGDCVRVQPIIVDEAMNDEA